MCQDKDVFDAMMMAGTPCPYDGKIGDEAKIAWESHDEKNRPYNDKAEEKEKDAKDIAKDIGLGMLGWLLIL